MTAAIQATLGTRTGCTLASFDLNRPLSLLHADGRTVTIPEQRAALQQCYDAVSAFIAGPDRPWLYLFGPPGGGKSHLALASYHALADQGAGVLTAAGLVAYLRAGVEGYETDARLQAVQHLPILLLDDLGTEELTPWGLARLYDVVEQRSVQRRPTVFTANVALDELSGLSRTVDDRVRWARLISRIAQHIAGPLAVLASDYRRLHWDGNPF
ncbi:MAG: ATP-binding protein [Chloroflexales bacterium]|nr:ATP-binding protein [Chloroflexales bacterium]